MAWAWDEPPGLMSAALIRSISLLVTAILLSRPGMPRGEAAHYAQVLNEVAAAQSFDPLTAVAMIHFETHWYPGLVSADGEDYGLGQVRARFVGACRLDEDPVNAPSEACLAVKAALRDGATNIRRMGVIIGANQAFCKEKTGTAKVHQWLAGYQGYGAPGRGIWCTPGDKTRQVLDYYSALVAKLVPKPKPKPAPKKAAPKSKPAPKPSPAPRARIEARPAHPAPGSIAKVKAKPAGRKR
jgi:hypothetical protein